MLATKLPFGLTGFVMALALGGWGRMSRDMMLTALAPTPVANAVVSYDGPPDPPVAPAASHEVQRGPDGLFYVNALVNGRPIRFLVDTGASVVVLTASDAQAVGVAREPHHYDRSVDTVGGSTPMAWTTLDNVSLAGHDVRNLKVAVVRNGLGVSLLGQNLLAQLDSVTIASDRLSLR